MNRRVPVHAPSYTRWLALSVRIIFTSHTGLDGDFTEDNFLTREMMEDDDNPALDLLRGHIGFIRAARDFYLQERRQLFSRQFDLLPSQDEMLFFCLALILVDNDIWAHGEEFAALTNHGGVLLYQMFPGASDSLKARIQPVIEHTLAKLDRWDSQLPDLTAEELKDTRARALMDGKTNENSNYATAPEAVNAYRAFMRDYAWGQLQQNNWDALRDDEVHRVSDQEAFRKYHTNSHKRRSAGRARKKKPSRRAVQKGRIARAAVPRRKRASSATARRT